MKTRILLMSMAVLIVVAGLALACDEMINGQETEVYSFPGGSSETRYFKNTSTDPNSIITVYLKNSLGEVVEAWDLSAGETLTIVTSHQRTVTAEETVVMGGGTTLCNSATPF